MRVLQLGNDNWEKKYTIPEDMEWHFNDFSFEEKKATKKKGIKSYDVILVTGKTNLTSDQLKKLKQLISPYHVLYSSNLNTELDDHEKYFLKSIAAQKIKEEPQYLIDRLPIRYFSGQSGLRIFPSQLKLNEHVVKIYEFEEQGHLKVNLDTHNEWVNLGTYKSGVFIDPDKQINFWLSLKNFNFQVRLRIFIQQPGTDGDVKEQRVIDLSSFNKDEYFSQIEASEHYRTATLNLEVKGSGDLIIGVLHSRWGRDGAGNFIAGGQRIVNPQTRDDIAYYFNPGDLKPPLNVYFSGAREAEGFEAYFLFKGLKAPMLLFTDMRLNIGQFYDDEDNFFEQEIIKTIKSKLNELGFDESQLLVSGISMGTYPAIKYGAKMSAHAINVAKPLVNLGYIASRTALDRPDEFETMFDIDKGIGTATDRDDLKKIDENFWKEFDKQDLSKTRFFAGYMINDDYDDKAVKELKESPAVKQAAQFSAKGFPGRHNDDPQVNYWFIDRLNELLREDFGRDNEKRN